MATFDEGWKLEGLLKLDPQVISSVYDQYFPIIFRYVRYRLGDTALAEDISSEVFLRMLEAVRKKRGPRKNVKGWLLGTASNIVSDHLRKVYRRPTEDLKESQPSNQTDPIDQVDQNDQSRLLREAMMGLTKEQQHVLALRFGEEMSLAETAKMMGKKTNAVKQLQFRALAALNRRIKERAQ